MNLPHGSFSRNSGLYIVVGSYQNTKIFSVVFSYAFFISDYFKASANMTIDNFEVDSIGEVTVSSSEVLGNEDFAIACMALTPYV